MLDGSVIILIAITFFIAGSVKGVIGLGLPTVSLALLTVIVGLKPAMALLIVPSLVTNIWQAVRGSNVFRLLFRIWPFLLFSVLTVWFGTKLLQRVDVELLSMLLGVVVVFYSITGLAKLQISVDQSLEKWIGPIIGAINGILTGMTGSFVFPGVLYLQAIGLSREALIQAMGMLFTVSTLALGLSLGKQNLITPYLGTISLFAVVPALIGMLLGKRLREKLSETTFRRVFFTGLLVLGLYIFFSSSI